MYGRSDDVVVEAIARRTAKATYEVMIAYIITLIVRAIIVGEVVDKSS